MNSKQWGAVVDIGLTMGGGGVPGGLSDTDPLRWKGVRSYEIDLSCLSQSMKTVEKY